MNTQHKSVLASTDVIQSASSTEFLLIPTVRSVFYVCVHCWANEIPAVTLLILTFRWHRANHCFQWDVCMVRDQLYSALHYVLQFLFSLVTCRPPVYS